MSQKQMTRAETIQALELRDGPNCFHPDCGKEFKNEEDKTFDHWIPQSKGGTWDIENLRLMHKRCNALKGDRMPNEDGTLPVLYRELNSAERRAVKHAQRPEICTKCNSGRALGEEDVCETCGSGPMPRTFPQWKKMKSSECDHDLFWCWACTLGFYERPAAILDVLNASELDE
jgi:hypothetical protein